MDIYMSIITNFGCHCKCQYCIAKNNHMGFPATTIDGLEKLRESIDENAVDILSISGGGDPLYNYERNVDWYRELFKKAQRKDSFGHTINVPIEMHTSYMTDESTFPFYQCKRVVYHANTTDQLNHIKRTGHEIVRVVYVVTDAFTDVKELMDIAKYVENSSEIDELSFRQMVDGNYETKHYLEDYLKLGHKKLWWYIEQDDYNLYYADNKVFTKYEDFKVVK